MLEKTNHHPVVCFGETLWDILPHGHLPGGAPLNVAYHLNRLGKNPAIISRVGMDELGEKLLQTIQSKSITPGFIQKDRLLPTGKVFAEIKENNEVHYDIIKPVAWDFIEWENRFADLVSEAGCFVFGSLITRDQVSEKTLFKCLEAANTKVLDINMRPPYFAKKSAEALLEKTDLLKLNLAELQLITGWFCDYDSDEDRIKLLKEKFNIETIVVTKGGDGAILNIGNIFYHHKGYPVTIADTVGSGDSFLAALISSFIDRSPPDEALDFACALGAFVTGCHGGCPDYEIYDINQLIETNKVQIIN